MATHGKVLNLLDERYLKLQDVVGQVQPFPTVLPYEEYTENVMVYNMDTDHSIFLGQMQDFTDRFARQTGSELWSWLVQWEVEEHAEPLQHIAPTPAFKKPRLDLPAPSPVGKSELVKPPPESRSPAYKTVGYRRFDSELLDDDNIIRALLAIVQCDDRVVPNTIEHLYRWIDYFEGDGTALVCALQHEIPSLWDFDHHPVTLPFPPRQPSPKLGEQVEAKVEQQTLDSDSTAEENERMQYMEKKFGLQPPKIDVPLTPLLNMPRQGRAQDRYLAACYKSRHRAIELLREAGITGPQMKNFVRGQEMSPRLTPDDEGGKGLENWWKSEKQYRDKAFLRASQGQREKYLESLISIQLSLEAKQADRESADSGAHAGLTRPSSRTLMPPPLIPLTPASAFTSPPTNTVTAHVDSSATTSKEPAPIINIPSVFFNKLRSKIFENAEPTLPSGGRVSALRDYLCNASGSQSGDTAEEDDEDEGISDEDSEYDVDVDDEDVGDEGMEDDENKENDGAYAPNAYLATLPTHIPRLQIQPDTPRPAGIASYIGGLSNAEMLQTVMPLLNPGISQTVATYTVASPPNPYLTILPTQVPNYIGAVAGSSNISGVGGAMNGGSHTASLFNTDAVTQQVSMAQLPVGSANSPAVPYHSQASNLPNITFTAPQESNSIQSSQQLAPNQPQIIAGSSFNALQLAPGQQVQPRPLTALPLLNHSSLSPGLRGLSMGNPSNSLVQNSFFGHVPSTINSPNPVPTMIRPPLMPIPTTVLPSFSPLRSGIQRNHSLYPIDTKLGIDAYAKLEALGSPVPKTPHGVPVVVHFPHIIRDRDLIDEYEKTDAVMLGYLHPSTLKIDLTCAMFLPAYVYSIFARKVRNNAYKVLESYTPAATNPDDPLNKGKSAIIDANPQEHPHATAYQKLIKAYNLMTSTLNREEELTKRWRVTPAPREEHKRGSVWEGWAMAIDKQIEIQATERGTAVMHAQFDEEEEREEELDEVMDEEWHEDPADETDDVNMGDGE
jgi:hypothetical protein